MIYDRELLSAYFKYDELSPSGLLWVADIFTGEGKKRQVTSIGSIAGGITKQGGYYYTRLHGKLYAIHRIIMVLFGFDIENKQIDHIDGNKANNNISNLRVVTAKENRRNMKLNSRNKTGITGVNYTEIPNGSGKINKYFSSKYTDHSGIRRSKLFNIEVLGEDVAFNLAKKFREEGLLITNSKLVESDELPYSERHGK